MNFGILQRADHVFSKNLRISYIMTFKKIQKLYKSRWSCEQQSGWHEREPS